MDMCAWLTKWSHWLHIHRVLQTVTVWLIGHIWWYRSLLELMAPTGLSPNATCSIDVSHVYNHPSSTGGSTKYLHQGTLQIPTCHHQSICGILQLGSYNVTTPLVCAGWTVPAVAKLESRALTFCGSKLNFWVICSCRFWRCSSCSDGKAQQQGRWVPLHNWDKETPTHA